MGRSKRNQGELRRLLREGAKVTMTWDMKPQEFKDHPDDIANAFNQSGIVDAPSHVVKIVDNSTIPQMSRPLDNKTLPGDSQELPGQGTKVYQVLP